MEEVHREVEIQKKLDTLNEELSRSELVDGEDPLVNLISFLCCNLALLPLAIIDNNNLLLF